jgi:putative ABC transport system permease protein
MFKNYVKIAWRNLLRYKAFSIINIGGLSIGIAVCLLISLYVHYELSYDAWNPGRDRVVRITDMMRTPESDNVVMAPSPVMLAASLRHNFPQIVTAVRFAPQKGVIKIADNLFNEQNVYETDANVFDVFPFRFIKGNPATALTGLHSMVITASIAKKYFGNDEPIGKNITCNKVSYRVSAVLADIPQNSDLPVNVLIPGDFGKTTSWMGDDFSVYTYALFKGAPDLTLFNNQLADLSKKYVQPELIKMGAVKYSLQFNTQLLKDVHFESGNLGDTEKGDRQLIYIFSVLAIVVLLLALLNYINLATARAAERAREVGIRKVNGALQSRLMVQFLVESLFVTSIALLIGIGLMFGALPLLNHLLNTRIGLSLAGSAFWLVCGLVLLSSLLTGLYPAFVLSSFQPTTALRAGFKHKAGGITLRKVITVIQFAAATVMIAGAFIMNRQISFVRHKSPGYTQNQVMNISLPDDSVALLQVPAFNNALKQLSQVAATSVQNGLSATSDDAMIKATTFAGSGGAKRQLMSNYFLVDEDFIPLLGINVIAGRNLSPVVATDKKEGFIVNEAFVKQMGWKNAIGQQIVGLDHTGRVIGVVSNFHYMSMHNPVAPLILVYRLTRPVSVLAKVNPANIALIKNTWKIYFPDTPFDFSFMDSHFDAVYKKDITAIKLFNYFTALAILVACLGLYGLAYLVAAQRTKEIGIRKVLGAAFAQLMVLLAKDFVKLIALAAVIAVPITLMVMNKWLAGYAYHISINWWVLLLPVAVIIFISLAVISYQTIKVALNNPVNSLKNE